MHLAVGVNSSDADHKKMRSTTDSPIYLANESISGNYCASSNLASSGLPMYVNDNQCNVYPFKFNEGNIRINMHIARLCTLFQIVKDSMFLSAFHNCTTDTGNVSSRY